MIPDRLRNLWRCYAGSIAFVTLILIAALGFARIENARHDACEGGNLLRAGLRSAEEEQIVMAESSNAALFPDIPKPVFEELVEASVNHSRRLIRVNFAPRDCGTHISAPFAGGVLGGVDKAL